jgi:hypothetical protein
VNVDICKSTYIQVSGCGRRLKLALQQTFEYPDTLICYV